MKTKLVAATLALSTLTAPAFAWGDREQGILSGIAGYWVFQQLTKPQQQGGAGQSQYPSFGGAVPPPPVIYQPNCRNVLVEEVDRYGRTLRYPMTVCN